MLASRSNSRHGGFGLALAPAALGVPGAAIEQPGFAAEGYRTQAARNDFIRGLFVTHSDTLRCYIRRRVKNEADVSEMVQEVYFRLMHRNAASKLHEAPEAYLFRTAINLIRDQHRRNTVRCLDRHVPLQDDVAQTQDADPEALLESTQLSAILRQAILELDCRTRQVLLLRLLCELSYREIEARTSIPLRSVERYMRQAVAYCCAKVEKQL